MSFDALVSAACAHAFGEAVTYTPQGGTAVTVTAVRYVTNEGDQFSKGRRSVSFEFQQSDVEARPEKDATIVASDATWTVKASPDAEIDGVWLALVEKAAR